MDFITKLPESKGCQNMIVVTDRLSKSILTYGLGQITAESVTEWFLREYYPYHFLPDVIVSDRGAQFVRAFWARVCQTLQIKRRLSTAFLPETDRFTERANQEIENFLREYVN